MPPLNKPATSDKPADEVQPVAITHPYVVARGRTVTTANGDVAAGQTVQLEEAEAKRFRDLGFILTDEGSVVVKTDGPAVNVEDGVQMTQQGTAVSQA